MEGEYPCSRETQESSQSHCAYKTAKGHLLATSSWGLCIMHTLFPESPVPCLATQPRLPMSMPLKAPRQEGPLPLCGNHRHSHNSRIIKDSSVQKSLVPWTKWPCSDINTQEVTFLGVGGCYLLSLINCHVSGIVVIECGLSLPFTWKMHLYKLPLSIEVRHCRVHHLQDRSTAAPMSCLTPVPTIPAVCTKTAG